MLALLFLLGGLFQLQIVEHSELLAQSEDNRIRVQPIVPQRGLVYDRDGRIIIDNRPSFTFSLVASQMVEGVTIPNVSELLGLSPEVLDKRFRRNLISRHQPAPVKRDVPFEVVAVVEEQAEKFPGVVIQIEDVRRYTTGLGAECFTGYTGEVSEEELKTLTERDYRLGSMIGKKGLERAYDSRLRGHEGTAYIEVTATGQALGPYAEKPPAPAIAGQGLNLSIDIDLQRACAAEIDSANCCGAFVAMDPRTGEILALSSFPSYDANIFSSVIPESLWTEIRNDSTYPLLNRPLDGLYPPGSTTKLITIGAAIEEGHITEHTILKACTGGYRFGNRVFHCWELSGHGQMNAAGSIERSCDVYLYQVGLKLGVDGLSKYFGLCGLGVPTGVDLPREQPGLNPNSDVLDEIHPRGWTQGVVLNLSIGQGELLVTPLQLAQFYCGIANDGVVYRPHILKSVMHPDGTTEEIVPEVAFRLPFKKKTLELLNESIRLVVEGDHGTAKNLRNRHYSIGGKTGTAQNPGKDNHSWFVGVAPLDKPEIVVCAIVEWGGHGSEVAAPAVGRIIEAYMSKYHPRETLAAAGKASPAPQPLDTALVVEEGRE